MTYYTRSISSSNTPLGATSLYHVVILTETIVGAIGSKWRAYKTRKALEVLCDEQLADIGIARSEISDVAKLLG